MFFCRLMGMNPRVDWACLGAAPIIWSAPLKTPTCLFPQSSHWPSAGIFTSNCAERTTFHLFRFLTQLKGWFTRVHRTSLKETRGNLAKFHPVSKSELGRWVTKSWRRIEAKFSRRARSRGGGDDPEAGRRPVTGQKAKGGRISPPAAADLSRRRWRLNTNFDPPLENMWRRKSMCLHCHWIPKKTNRILVFIFDKLWGQYFIQLFKWLNQFHCIKLQNPILSWHRC